MSAAEVCYRNPFPESDPDRRSIWDLLVRRDFEAFVNCDWEQLEGSFCKDNFVGVDASGSLDPDQWKIRYPTVLDYRDEWLKQSRAFAKKQLVSTNLLQFLYQACCLSDIEIARNRAAAHKKFNGQCRTIDGEEIALKFQTFYQLIKQEDEWRISGFIGYLPFAAMGGDHNTVRPLTE